MELLADHPKVDMHAKNKWGCAAVQWAASSGNVGTCRWLMCRGVDLRLINDAKHGAVSKAAWHGHLRLLEWLVLGEDGPRLLEQVSLRDHDGCSVADRARLNGHEDTARWLERQQEATVLRESKTATR